MPRATISLAFALHSGLKLALAKSHGLSSTSAADSATPPPEKATRCLFKVGPDHFESPAGDTFEEFEQGSFAAASMQQHQRLQREGKCTSSTGCSVWNGYLSDKVGGYYGWYSPHWGNLLSEYWEARGAAALAGVKFEASPIPGETWLSKLPSKHNSDPAYKDDVALAKMCNACTGGMFPHQCVGKWTRIRQMIRDDTQAALKTFSQEANMTLPVFHENDVLVHIRLEQAHGQVAYYGKSFFDGHIPKGASRIILLSAQPQWGKPILESYVAVFKELCQHRQPQCIVDEQKGTQFNDFAAIALAPTVFCSGSTYCLWAAMANPGNAIMSSHYIADGKMPPIDDWTWVKGHVLPNTERKHMPTEEWISHVAKWVQKN